MHQRLADLFIYLFLIGHIAILLRCNTIQFDHFGIDFTSNTSNSPVNGTTFA